MEVGTGAAFRELYPTQLVYYEKISTSLFRILFDFCSGCVIDNRLWQEQHAFSHPKAHSADRVLAPLRLKISPARALSGMLLQPEKTTCGTPCS
jgi:hypothetical protein